jgi:hypothetical protein
MKTTKILEVSQTKFRSVRNLSLACAGTALCAVAALAQVSTEATSSNANAIEQSTASSVAYVYVSTSKGIDVYDAASNGTLAQVSGSPFKTSGQMIGSNGKYLVSVGASDIYTNKIESNGGIGPQASSFNADSHSGGQCGNTSGAVLDHTGLNVYVSLKGAPADDGNNLCDAIQSSSISSSSGDLTYKGDVLVDDDQKISGSDTLPVMLGNNSFAYSWEASTDSCQASINILARESSGALELAADQNVNYPAGPAGGYYYYPLYPSNVSGDVQAISPSLITDDGTNHLAIALFAMSDAPCGPTKAPQLGSFTAASNGSLTSTNTAENMPTVGGGGVINVMRMSPAGNLLAVATGTGVQFFHFNGAAPITKFTGVIGTSGYVSDVQWDKSNHLYAINGTSGKLHVYTVTTTSVVEAAGSPYSIGASSSPIGLAVVPE